MNKISKNFVLPSLIMVGIAVVSSSPLLGQDDEKVDFLYSTLNEALIAYEELTGLKIIADPDLNAGEKSINVDSRGPLTRDEAILFLEKSLLLTDLILVPSGENTLKLVEAQIARAEGVPIISQPEELRQIDTDFLVTYVMHFAHLPAEDAMTAFTSVTESHPYGKMTVLPDGMTLAITENTAVIHKYLELKDFIDVPVEERIHRTFCLERAKASEVAEQLAELLELGSTSTSTSGSSSRGNTQPVGNTQGARTTGRTSGQTGGVGNRPRITREPKIAAIDRTNSLLVMAHPVQMSFIEGLVGEFDAPASHRTYMTVRLKYKPVLEILPIARDAIARGEDATGTSSRGTTPTRNTTTTTTVTPQNTNSSFGSSGFTASTSRGGSTSLSEPTNQGGPQSLTVGETLLIADPGSNELFVSGPPEHLMAIETLVEQIDKRSRQIYLSTVIGQLTLGNNVELGLDLVRNVTEFDVANDSSRLAGVLQSRNTGRDDQGLIDPATLTDIAGFLPAAQGLTLYGTLAPRFNSFIELLEADTRFKVIQRPSVFAVNNEKAVIQTGQKIAVPTSTLSTLSTGTINPSVTSNIQFQDVVLRLEVIPLINSDDEVTLTISQVNDNIVGSTNISGNDIPTIGTQELVTKVIVPDGATVLLGGLISEDVRNSVAGIPKLVHVPLLKHLAGSERELRNRQELLIFIKPHIISTNCDLADANIENVEGKEVMANTDHIVQPGPIEAIVGNKPYVFSRKVKPVEEKPFRNIRKLFSRKRETPQVYQAE